MEKNKIIVVRIVLNEKFDANSPFPSSPKPLHQSERSIIQTLQA